MRHDLWVQGLNLPFLVGISIDMESQYKAKGSEEWGEIRLLVQAVLTATDMISSIIFLMN